MKMEATFIEKLADFYNQVEIEGIPEKVVQKTRLSFLDYLFCYTAGFQNSSLKAPIQAFVRSRVTEKSASLLLTKLKLNCDLAALASSSLSHSVELDDGHRFGTAHPAVVVFPSSFAIAEKKGSTVSEFIRASAIGYDLMLRLSRSINPAHLKRGFHSTSTTGPLGSAASMTSLLRLDTKTSAHAYSLALLTSSGIQEMLHSHPESKSLQVGWACQSGMIAAEMAAMGARGPRSVLEGEHGWLRAMTDSFNEAGLLSELGDRWEILQTYTKLYPSCRHCHPALDLCEAAWKEKLPVSKIQSIKFFTYSLGIAEVGQIEAPKDKDEAMFSLPFTASVVLHKGSLSYSDLTTYLAEPEVLRLSKMIEVFPDLEMDGRYPQERGCRLEIVLNDGSRLSFSNHLPKGEPETPLDEEAYLKKFVSISEPLLASDQVHRIYERVMTLPMKDPIAEAVLDCFRGGVPK